MLLASPYCFFVKKLGKERREAGSENIHDYTKKWNIFNPLYLAVFYEYWELNPDDIASWLLKNHLSTNSSILACSYNTLIICTPITYIDSDTI